MIDPSPNLADALLKLAASQERIADVLEQINQKLDVALPETGSKQDAANLLGISIRTLDRRMAQFQEGIHYWGEGSKLIFDLELLRDWQRNRHNPAAHQRAIELRRKQLLSQQKQQRKSS
ncbi:helix-turn-helix domain-containing protein [Leptolyngbya sp. ST-U4]|uniref:helix-turn-helix domain-containing protein n=1 Tax=Leptolyngbya sp. ST-U4 TaxID=2933912 RepID=UPI003298981D